MLITASYIFKHENDNFKVKYQIKRFYFYRKSNSLKILLNFYSDKLVIYNYNLLNSL